MVRIPPNIRNNVCLHGTVHVGIMREDRVPRCWLIKGRSMTQLPLVDDTTQLKFMQVTSPGAMKPMASV